MVRVFVQRLTGVVSEEMILKEKYNRLNEHFWTSKDGFRICSPWLWLGRSYQLSNGEEDALRDRIRNSIAWRLIHQRRFSALGAALIVLIYNYYDLSDFQILYLLSASAAVFLICRLIISFGLWLHSKKKIIHNQDMTFEKYQTNIMDTSNKVRFVNTMPPIIICAIIFSFTVYVGDFSKNFTVMIVVATQVYLLWKISMLRAFFHSQEELDEDNFDLTKMVTNEGRTGSQ